MLSAGHQPDWLHESERSRIKGLRTKAYLAQVTLGAALIYWVGEAAFVVAYRAGWVVPADAVDLMTSAEVLYPVLLLAAAVLFVIWSYTAHASLKRFGRRGIRRSDQATIWWWFVPFASFVVPYRVIGETTRGSVARVDDLHWNDVDSPSIVGWWTGFFVSGLLVSGMGGGMADSATSIAALDSAATVMVLGSLLMIAAATTAIGLIQVVTTAQAHLANTLWPVADGDVRRPVAPAGHGFYEPPTHTG